MALSANFLSSASETAPLSILPSTIIVSGLNEAFKTSTVYPRPLPPDVAKSTIFLPEKS